MSEIRANTVSNAAGTGPVTLTGQYAAKAWVNFNGTGTVAIRESGNVSSITDNNAGSYTVNFTNAFSDSSYSSPLGVSNGSNAYRNIGIAVSPTSSSVGIDTLQAESETSQDAATISVSIFR